MKKKVFLFLGSALAFALTFSVNLTGADLESVSVKANEAQAFYSGIPVELPHASSCPDGRGYSVYCLGLGSGCIPIDCDDEAPQLN